jgi:hypothetical protein
VFAGRGRRPPACGPAIAGKCERATASAAGTPARCGVVRIRARMTIEARLGLTARGAGRVRRRCDGGEPGRPMAHGSGYGCRVRASERAVRSVEAKEAERRRRWPTRGLRWPRVEAAVSRQRTGSFATDGLRLEGVGPGWRYLRVVGPELRWGRGRCKQHGRGAGRRRMTLRRRVGPWLGPCEACGRRSGSG